MPSLHDRADRRNVGTRRIRPDLIREGFASVRLEVSGVGHFHLAGSLNGNPMEVLLDTGAGSTIVDKTIAEELGLVLNSIEVRGGGAGSASLALWSVEQAVFEIGGTPLTGTQILAMDFANIRAALAAKGISPPKMILGSDVLRSRGAIIDYGTNLLWIKTN